MQRQMRARRVGVARGERMNTPVGFSHVDRGPISQFGHDEVHEAVERFLKSERESTSPARERNRSDDS